MSNLKGERIFFYGFDEIRAIAALLVFFHHIEYHKYNEALPSLVDVKLFHVCIEKIGSNAVIAFFVLSGFLITYLLLVEKERTGTVNIKAFYVRRILRIWPLYFLVVLVGFVLMPLLNKTGLFSNQHYYNYLIGKINYNILPFFLLFLSNFALKYFKPIAGAAQSWSVSVEEQFYLIWPHIIKYFNGMRNSLSIVIALFILKIGLREVILYFYGKTFFYELLNIISIEYMFIGSIAAMILYWNKNNFMFQKLLKSKLLLLLTIMFIVIEIVSFNHSVIIAGLFAGFILLISAQKVEIKFLKYFGKISYGIYMLHPLALFISFSIAFNIKNPIGFNVAFYLISFGLTIMFAGLSYKYFESPILKLKKRHTIIKSGENTL